jgi:hypothetical protein
MIIMENKSPNHVRYLNFCVPCRVVLRNIVCVFNWDNNLLVHFASDLILFRQTLNFEEKLSYTKVLQKIGIKNWERIP